MQQQKIIIEEAWNSNDPDIRHPEIIAALEETISAMDSGRLRASEKVNDLWVTNEFVKKGILLYFRYNEPSLVQAYPTPYYDKIKLKTSRYTKADFAKAGFRCVPGAIIRYGSYIADKVVVMPSFINIGAYIDTGTMIDSGVTIGSCAQIGKDCHISSNVVIAGVLEPIQANPVIIEDEVFIGAGSIISEGSIIEGGAVLGSGVTISASSKIIDIATGEVFYGRVPKYSVVVPGAISKGNDYSIGASLIIKKVDAKTRVKTSINEILRG